MSVCVCININIWLMSWSCFCCGHIQPKGRQDTLSINTPQTLTLSSTLSQITYNLISAHTNRAWHGWSGCHGICPAFVYICPAQKPDIHHSICSSCDRLGFNADIQNIFGTVHALIDTSPAEYTPHCPFYQPFNILGGFGFTSLQCHIKSPSSSFSSASSSFSSSQHIRNIFGTCHPW